VLAEEVEHAKRHLLHPAQRHVDLVHARPVAALEAGRLGRAEHQGVRDGSPHDVVGDGGVDRDHLGGDAEDVLLLVLFDHVGRDVLLRQPPGIPGRAGAWVLPGPFDLIAPLAVRQRAVAQDLLYAVVALFPRWPLFVIGGAAAVFNFGRDAATRALLAAARRFGG